jgi:hypothetical protein
LLARIIGKTMQKNLLKAVFLMISISALNSYAQQENAVLQTFSAGGGYFSNGKINVSYNIGDPIFYSDSNQFEDFLIFQGFEQPDYFENVTVLPEVVGDYDVTVFPNPFQSFVKVRIVVGGDSSNITDNELFTFRIFDILGKDLQIPGVTDVIAKAIRQPQSGSNEISAYLDMSALKADQVYLLQVNAVISKFSKTLKIIKIDGQGPGY